jgi:hypothetical protein
MSGYNVLLKLEGSPQNPGGGSSSAARPYRYQATRVPSGWFSSAFTGVRAYYRKESLKAWMFVTMNFVERPVRVLPKFFAPLSS